MRVKKKITVGNKAKKKLNAKAEALRFNSLLPIFLIKNSKTAYKETSLVPGILISAVFLTSHFTGLRNSNLLKIILHQLKKGFNASNKFKGAPQGLCVFISIQIKVVSPSLSKIPFSL